MVFVIVSVNTTVDRITDKSVEVVPKDLVNVLIDRTALNETPIMRPTISSEIPIAVFIGENPLLPSIYARDYKTMYFFKVKPEDSSK